MSTTESFDTSSGVALVQEQKPKLSVYETIERQIEDSGPPSLSSVLVVGGSVLALAGAVRLAGEFAHPERAESAEANPSLYAAFEGDVINGESINAFVGKSSGIKLNYQTLGGNISGVRLAVYPKTPEVAGTTIERVEQLDGSDMLCTPEGAGLACDIGSVALGEVRSAYVRFHTNRAAKFQSIVAWIGNNDPETPGYAAEMGFNSIVFGTGVDQTLTPAEKAKPPYLHMFSQGSLGEGCKWTKFEINSEIDIKNFVLKKAFLKTSKSLPHRVTKRKKILRQATREHQPSTIDNVRVCATDRSRARVNYTFSGINPETSKKIAPETKRFIFSKNGTWVQVAIPKR